MTDVWCKNGFTISTNKDYLDYEEIHRFLSELSYWAQGRSLETVKRSIAHSALCFGIYYGNVSEEKQVRQAGFARVISDMATFAYLSDVFVIPEFRGKGLGKWLVETIVSHPDLTNIRRFMLTTRDAHLLYAKYGFQEIDKPENFLNRINQSMI